MEEAEERECENEADSRLMEWVLRCESRAVSVVLRA
jgi:hypothetical protein